MRLNAYMRLFKEEAVAGKYQVSMVATALGGMKKYLSLTFKNVRVYWRGNHALWFYEEDAMEAIAAEIVKRASMAQLPAQWGIDYERIKNEVRKKALAIAQTDVEARTPGELHALYDDLRAAQRKIWALMICIDSFDNGSDEIAIQAISGKYGLDAEETAILLQPRVLSYVALWEHARAEYMKGVRSFASLHDEFFWIRSDYFEFDELTEAYVRSTPLEHKTYSASAIPSDKDVLERHSLEHNPLEVFRTLTEWRDMRKQLNFMSQYGFLRILTELARRYSIPKDVVRQLVSSEAENLFKGVLEDELLQRATARKDGEFFANYADDGTYEISEGAGARAARAAIEKYIPAFEEKELRGMVACRGIVRGIARIVPNMHDSAARAFLEGDILITSMTRPEFLPLMKKAGAIVTNEGGISSHAAIVARELKKPCIIGTRYATHVLNDGDTIEVDANEGIVRMIEKAHG